MHRQQKCRPTLRLAAHFRNQLHRPGTPGGTRRAARPSGAGPGPLTHTSSGPRAPSRGPAEGGHAWVAIAVDGAGRASWVLSLGCCCRVVGATATPQASAQDLGLRDVPALALKHAVGLRNPRIGAAEPGFFPHLTGFTPRRHECSLNRILQGSATRQEFLLPRTAISESVRVFHSIVQSCKKALPPRMTTPL